MSPAKIGLMSLVHVAAIGGMAAYLTWHGLTWAAAVIGLVLTGVTIFAISAGYHRLFSHRSYEAHPLVRLFLLVFGAGSFQNSLIEWAADHRRHHARTDTDEDPYNARGGFWYSHMGWVLLKSEPNPPHRVIADLEADPLVVWQDRHYAVIAIAAGLVFPTLLGFIFGDPIGGFVVGAALRLLVCYHATFSINSFAHRLGSQRYTTRSSARDNVVVALFSMGEGYHNYHHAFPTDYRNGVRAMHYDPTKWILRVLAALGLVRNLRRASPQAILRARLRTDEESLAAQRLEPTQRARIHGLRVTIEEALDRLHVLLGQRAPGQAAELRLARRELRARLALWRQAIRPSLPSATLSAT